MHNELVAKPADTAAPPPTLARMMACADPLCRDARWLWLVVLYFSATIGQTEGHCANGACLEPDTRYAKETTTTKQVQTHDPGLAAVGSV